MPDVPKEAEMASTDARDAGVEGEEAEEVVLSIPPDDATDDAVAPVRAPPPPLPPRAFRVPPLPRSLLRSMPELPPVPDLPSTELVSADLLADGGSASSVEAGLSSPSSSAVDDSAASQGTDEEPPQSERTLLRAEVSATEDPRRKARLLGEVGEAQERAGDFGAARATYAEAIALDPTARVAIEGFLRTARTAPREATRAEFERALEALDTAAVTPEERVRALVQRATFLADAGRADADPAALAEAHRHAREATEIAASATDVGTAWVLRERLAARLADDEDRHAALAGRAELAEDPHWRGLLLIDVARLAAKAGRVEEALDLLARVRTEGGAVAWRANETAEALLTRGDAGSDDVVSEHLAGLFEERAARIAASIVDPEKGDAVGIPRADRTPLHAVHALLLAAERRAAAGDDDSAHRAIERAERLLVDDRARSGDGLESIPERLLATLSLRHAYRTGERARAAELALLRIESEVDGPTLAALSLYVAEQAANEGDAARALDVLANALQNDEASIPALARTWDLAAVTDDVVRLAETLERIATRVTTPEARGRTLVLASYVWACRARDASRARDALVRAVEAGVDRGIVARLGRSFASLLSNDEWYEAATAQLIASLGGSAGSDAPAEHTSRIILWAEVARLRLARGDEPGFARVTTALRGLPDGAWLGRVLESFGGVAPDVGEPTAEGGDGREDLERTSDTSQSHARAALEQLALDETDPERRKTLLVTTVLRDNEHGETERAVATLRALSDEDPSDALVAGYLGELLRATGDAKGAAAVAMTLAAAPGADDTFAGTRLLEAGLSLLRAEDPTGALAAFDSAAALAPEAASPALPWLARRAAPDTLEGRRRALAYAEDATAPDATCHLERFALEATLGEATDATSALARAAHAEDAAVRLAAAIAQIAWHDREAMPDALDDALLTLGTAGEAATRAAAAELVLVERTRAGTSATSSVESAASAWFDVGGGAVAALEWFGATMAMGSPVAELRPRRHLAEHFAFDAREELHASCRLIEGLVGQTATTPLEGTSAAVRLANLELTPPASPATDRARALAGVDDALTAEERTMALGLAAWSWLAAGDTERALTAFRDVTGASPSDLHAWEGLRTAAAILGDKSTVANACEQLGARVKNNARGATFWEHAALTWLELTDVDTTANGRADAAFDACLTRDPTREAAFDKRFRRARDAGDEDRVLSLAELRLTVTDDAAEIAKMYWEMARVLRKKGNVDAALEALEHVTLFDEDHVGALALTGEIFIRRGLFAEAAEKLARLARVPSAPPKNRLTAGIAAVDLYENKLASPERALEVLLALHAEKLTTLPIRERLARAAAKTGAWTEATKILEELMVERPERAGRIEAARLAMIVHRDRRGDAPGAIGAISALLGESPGDADALDVLLELEATTPSRRELLDRGSAALMDQLASEPTDAARLTRLARIANALDNPRLERSALMCVRAVGDADRETEERFGALAANDERVPSEHARPAELEGLAAPDDSGPIAQLFAALGPSLAEAFGPSLASLGVHPRKDRIDPRAGLLLRTETAAWLAAFGITEFDLYVGGKDPEGVQGIAGETPAIVMGAQVRAPLSPLIRGRIAREAFAVVRGSTVVRSRDDRTIAAIVTAACKLTKTKGAEARTDGTAEIERALGKALSRKTKAAIEPLCLAIVQGSTDAGAWALAARASLLRASLVASGDVALIFGTADADASHTAPPMAETLRFVLSPTYFALREALGLEVNHG